MHAQGKIRSPNSLQHNCRSGHSLSSLDFPSESGVRGLIWVGLSWRPQGKSGLEPRRWFTCSLSCLADELQLQSRHGQSIGAICSHPFYKRHTDPVFSFLSLACSPPSASFASFVPFPGAAVIFPHIGFTLRSRGMYGFICMAEEFYWISLALQQRSTFEIHQVAI